MQWKNKTYSLFEGKRTNKAQIFFEKIHFSKVVLDSLNVPLPEIFLLWIVVLIFRDWLEKGDEKKVNKVEPHKAYIDHGGSNKLNPKGHIGQPILVDHNLMACCHCTLDIIEPHKRVNGY